MEYRSSRLIFSSLVVLVLLATVLIGVDAEPPAEAAFVSASVENVASDEEGLFAPSNQRVSVNVPAQAIRYRNVTADFSPFLSANGRAASTTEVADALTLNLFSDVVVEAQLDRYNHNMQGSVSWMGHVTNVEQSEVLLVVKDDVLVGLITVGTDVYEIRYGGNGNQIILELDQSKFVDHPADWKAVVDEQIAAYEAELGANPRAADVAADDGSVIDILVGYTEEAKNGAGSTAAIESTAQLAVDATNASYENAQISQRLYLVHTEEFAYTESGNNTTDLYRWTYTNAEEPSLDPAGDMDNAQTLRDTYHADVMMLLVEGASASGCGVAWHQSTMSASFESLAYGVTVRSCAVGNLTFAHEVGHNLGLRHDWYVDDSQTPESYAHGHTYPQAGWRTVMAYNNYCSSLGVSCTRLTYFSNPSVQVNGVVAGVEGGTSDNCVEFMASPAANSCDADSERLLNDNNTIYAAWRSSQITWVGNTSDWNTASNWSIDLGTPGATSSTNRVPLSIDDVYIPANPTGGNFPELSSGTAVARNVVLEDGASMTINGGTLELYGQWEEQGSNGSTAGSSGTVQFVGTFDQTISTRAASTLPNVLVGNGSTSQEVSFVSDIDINGDFTIFAGAGVKAGSVTAEFAGDWDDQANSFDAETSSVIFDGASQSVTKTTNSTLVTEDFSAYTTCGCTSGAPIGWARSGDGLSFLFGDEIAYHWRDSTDAWLFTPAFDLAPNVDYTISFDQRKGTSSSVSSLSVAYGTSQASAAMTNVIGGISNAEMSTSFQGASFTFTVDTAGTYYIGINSMQTAPYSRLDNISLTAEQNLSFYDLQVSNGETLFNKPVDVDNDLLVDSGATADFSTHIVRVDGTVTNNGSMKQTKPVPTSATTRFLAISDRDGSATAYAGVDLTPSTGSMGDTTVTVRGNQQCSSVDVIDSGVSRCYDIDPTTTQTAVVRLYYSSSEANGNSEPNVFNETSDGSDVWVQDAGTTNGGSGIGFYAESSGVTNYGQFALSSGPTVSLSGDSGLINEGDSGTTTYTFTATLNIATGGAFDVPVTINDGTATTADGDYSDNDQTLNFAGTAGETKVFTVSVNGDDTVEANETFRVALGAPSDGTTGVSGTPWVATIYNDDIGTINLSGGTSQMEGDSGTVSYVFTATLDTAVQGGVSVSYATDDITAQAGSDYTSQSGTFNFVGNANETHTVTVLANGDTLLETDEQFMMSIFVPSHPAVLQGGTPQFATILNDDIGFPVYLPLIITSQ